MLQNPAGFGQAEVQQWYERGGQDIDDQFSQAKTGAEEEMARRGLSASSTLGGRLADLNVQKRSAQVDLRDRLGRQLAEEQAKARDMAIGRGIQFDEYQTQADIDQQRLGIDAGRLNLDADLGFGRLGLDTELGRDKNAIDRLGISEDARQFDADYDLDRSKFGEEQYQFDEDTGLRRDQLGEDVRQFDVDTDLKREDQGLRRDMFGEETRQFGQRFGEEVRQYDQDFGMRGEEFDWAKQRDLAEYLERTSVMNPDVNPDVAREVDPESEGWW
jgi:hypothetical protein